MIPNPFDAFPLPKYISTVDSGNLAAHLLVLRQGLLALPYQKILSSNLFEGIRDTWNVLIGTLKVKDIELVKEFNDYNGNCL